VLLGWLYAAGVMAGWAWWERARVERARVVPATDADLETA
jgi:predicted negative regulator of RcsB-dependent stress response